MAKYKIGDKVRVKADLNFNVEKVQELLGQVCTIDSIDDSHNRVAEYKLRFENGQVEPFWGYEIEPVGGFSVEINEKLIIKKNGYELVLNTEEVKKILGALIENLNYERRSNDYQ